jgi:CRP-like cAMP-binding protein
MDPQARALRLVRTGPERHALRGGELDAIVDAGSGNVFVLPQARRALSWRGGEPANGVLAALPHRDYLHLLGECELVHLTLGQVLHQPGDRIGHVYFPNDAVVSLLVVLELKALEVCLVGREGVVGVSLALGVERASARAMVGGAGTALRMKAASFREAFEGSVPLQRELLRYANAKLVQARQTGGCGRFHQSEERLAYWLLMAHDRMPMNGNLQITHDLLADMLGVRRVGITNAAGNLQRRGLIKYHRGNIRILERKGLEAAACSCYRIVKTLAG